MTNVRDVAKEQCDPLFFFLFVSRLSFISSFDDKDGKMMIAQ